MYTDKAFCLKAKYHQKHDFLGKGMLPCRFEASSLSRVTILIWQDKLPKSLVLHSLIHRSIAAEFACVEALREEREGAGG